MKEGTQIELLHLPLNEDREPTADLTQSRGRLMALHQDGPDPATLIPGTMVTFVGEVSGATTEKLDEVDYRYPTVTVKLWHPWSLPVAEQRRDGSRFGIYGGMGVGGGIRGGGGGIGIGF